MNNIFCLCFFVATALTAFGADKPDEAKLLQGVWTPVKAELGGQSMPEVILKTISLEIDKHEYKVLVAGAPDRGTYTLDLANSPKSLTVTGTEGPNQGKVFPAIYELNADSLRICYDLSGAKRPTEFKSIAGTQLYLVTYSRKKE